MSEGTKRWWLDPQFSSQPGSSAQESSATTDRKGKSPAYEVEKVDKGDKVDKLDSPSDSDSPLEPLSFEGVTSLDGAFAVGYWWEQKKAAKEAKKAEKAGAYTHHARVACVPVATC